MRPITKASIVLLLYLAALVAAYVTVTIYAIATAGPDRQTSAGMYAFGDMLLFLAVFAVAAIPATAATAAEVIAFASVVVSWFGGQP